MARAFSARKPRGNSPMTTLWPGRSSRCSRLDSHSFPASSPSPRRPVPSVSACPPRHAALSFCVSVESAPAPARAGNGRWRIRIRHNAPASRAPEQRRASPSGSARRVMGAWWPPRSSKPSSRHGVSGGVFDPLPLRQLYSTSRNPDRLCWRQARWTGSVF